MPIPLLILLSESPTSSGSIEQTNSSSPELHKKEVHWVCRMVHSQQVKLFATKPDDMSSISRTHMVK